MNKNILVAIAVFISAFAFAQNSEQQQKTEQQQKEERRKEVANDARDRLVFGFTFDNWIIGDDSLGAEGVKTKWNSWGFHFYFMYDLPLGKSRFSFAPGAGFSGSWVKNNAYLDEIDNLGTRMRPWGDSIDYKRNSLANLYFDVPLELRYRSRPNEKNKSFKLALGAVAGIQMRNYTSITTSDTDIAPRGDTKKFRTYRHSDIARFRFGPTMRIGYGAANVFFYYSVTSLFKRDSGPDVHPFSVGFSINGL